MLRYLSALLLLACNRGHTVESYCTVSNEDRERVAQFIANCSKDDEDVFYGCKRTAFELWCTREYEVFRPTVGRVNCNAEGLREEEVAACREKGWTKSE